MIRRAILAVPLLVTAAAFGAPSHVDFCRTAIARLPVASADKNVDYVDKAEQLEAIAVAVAEVSRNKPLPPQQWAALVLTVGQNESAFSMRIIANECRRHECDGGRARGFGQVHSNTLNRQDWIDAPGNVAVQAKLTSDALTRAFWTCARSGVPAVQATLSAYAGRQCGAKWLGLDARLATFKRLTGGK